MIRIIRMMFLLWLFLAGVQSTAVAASLDKVNELYQKSGMEEQAADISANAENGVQQAVSQGPAVPPEMLDKLIALFKNNFSADVLRPEVINVIAQKMTNEQIDQCLVWLDSSVGQKITQEEIKASDPSSFSELQKFSEDFQSNPPDAVRVEAVSRLLEETHVLDYSVSLMVTLQKAMMVSMALPSDYASPRFEQILRQLDDSKDQLREQLQPQVENVFYFTYRNISTAELKQYLDFLSSDVGRIYSEVSKEGLLNGIKVAGERIGGQMKERGAK